MRAAIDLMRRIPARAPRRIADVYKGRGSMSALLARRFPNAEIEAFDLLQSTDHDSNLDDRRLSARPKFDLICSNGSLEIVSSLPTLVAHAGQLGRRRAGALQLNFPTICTSQAARSCG